MSLLVIIFIYIYIYIYISRRKCAPTYFTFQVKGLRKDFPLSAAASQEIELLLLLKRLNHNQTIHVVTKIIVKRY